MAKRYCARKLFNKLNVLNELINGKDANVRQAANKAKRRLPDVWFKRSNGNAGTFFKAKNDKASVCFITKG